MKKKIAILYSGAKNWGGIEKYLFDFLESKHDDIDLTLLSMGNWELTKKLEGKVRVQFLPASRFNPFLPLRLGRFLRSNKVEILVSQGVVSNFYSRLATFFSDANVITIIHSELESEYKNLFVSNLYQLLDWLLRFRTKKFICVSEYLKNTLIRKGILGSKIKVVHNGVRDIFEKDTVKKIDKIIIGSVGRLEREKGMDLLVEAAKLLPENYEIRICGEGSERKRLSKLISKNNLSKKVALMGFKGEIEGFYSDLSLYVQPSRSEGFGLTVVEAMLAGVPVIVSDRGALPELVQNGECGIICKDLNSMALAGLIEESITNAKNLDSIAVKAREFALLSYGIETWRKNLSKELSL